MRSTSVWVDVTVDVTCCPDTLLNGSYNWTRSASSFNEENLVVSSEPFLVQTFARQFDALWDGLGR